MLGVIGLLVLTLSLAGWTRAEEPVLDDTEPPVRLKKKVRPDKDARPDEKTFRPAKKDEKDKKGGKPDPSKDNQAKKPAPKRPDKAAEERKKLVQRVLKNMRHAEERLAKNDPGRGTRDIQRDIVKDLDELIDQVKKNPPPQNSSQRMERRPNSQRNPKNSSNPRNSSQKNPGGKNGKRNQPNQGGGRNNQGGGGNGRDKRDNKLADLFKDVWGHLPETMREEMDAYSRAKFIPKYELLLKEYYRTLSEQGSRK
jgi:hypothetical protein